MKKDSIVHFVGFVTRLPQSDFIDQWSTYARAFKSLGSAMTLQGKNNDTGRFKYISQHEFNEEEFRFAFTSERQSGNFPDQKARVVMLGGYSPVKIGCKRWDEDKFAKVMLFHNQDSIDMDYYHSLVGNDQLNVYQPFYENCVYQLIMEFFVPEGEVPDLVSELAGRKEGVEISLYRKCPTFASAMK